MLLLVIMMFFVGVGAVLTYASGGGRWIVACPSTCTAFIQHRWVLYVGFGAC